MNDLPRYAIYFAPPADHLLWKLGSEWLGRDAYTGQKVERREFPALKDEGIDRLTSSPARYGFHATMKAPFELKAGCTEQDLIVHLDKFVQSQSPFQTTLGVKALGQFVALRQVDRTEAMRTLHSACVIEFDGYRAPLSEEDIERRRRANLSLEQDERMLKWGYPYIFDDFRWHMTLSNKVVSSFTREKVLSVLREHFAVALSTPLTIDGIAIYRQLSRSAPFNILHRSAFKVLADQSR